MPKYELTRYSFVNGEKRELVISIQQFQMFSPKIFMVLVKEVLRIAECYTAGRDVYHPGDMRDLQRSQQFVQFVGSRSLLILHN